MSRLLRQLERSCRQTRLQCREPLLLRHRHSGQRSTGVWASSALTDGRSAKFSTQAVQPLVCYWADWAEVILPEGHRFPMARMASSEASSQPVMTRAQYIDSSASRRPCSSGIKRRTRRSGALGKTSKFLHLATPV